MNFSDLIRWALRQIRVRLLESILIVIGVALGVTVICSVVGLIAGYNQQMSQQMSGPQLRMFTLVPAQYGYTGMEYQPLTRIGRSDEKPITLTYDDYVKLRDADIEGLQAVWLSSWGSDINPDAVQQPDPQKSSLEEMQKWQSENMISYRLVTPEVFRVIDAELVKGDWIRAEDVAQKRRIAVIGQEMAERYFAGADPIGREVHLSTGSFTVVGVVHADTDKKNPVYYPGIGMDSELNQTLFIPYFSMENPMAAQGTDMVPEIDCMVKEAEQIKTVYQRLQAYAQEQYGEQVAVVGTYNYMDEAKQAMRSIEQVIGLFACAALIIAAINILNLMMARVLRRTKHIGISAAVGASRRTLFQLFMMESLLLGLTGSLLGIGFAYGATKLLGSLTQLPMQINILTWVIGIGSALLISLISGLYPAGQAARVHPAVGLKVE